MELKFLFRCSQETATGPCSKFDETSSHLVHLKYHLILSSLPYVKSPEWSGSLRVAE